MRIEIKSEACYVYIATDLRKSVLEPGIAGSLNVRLQQMKFDDTAPAALESNPKCFYLIYWEKLPTIQDAMNRLKQIKKLSRKKKEALIASSNPEGNFLNEQIEGN